MAEVPKWREQLAPARKYNETVLFIHHFGGNASSSKRHQDLVNKIGFNSASLSLSFNAPPRWTGSADALKKLAASASSVDLIRRWAAEIHEACERIDGPKIIYSFSSPSAGALGAIIDSSDVRAWICDGGPFS